MRLNLIGSALIGMGLAAESQANGAYLPLGVQQNVAMSAVTGAGGWTVVYQGLYGSTSNLPISTAFAGVNSTDYVMFAAAPVGSTTFTLLAAAVDSDVQKYTALNATTTSNGAQWYYNGYSMGFAGLGDTISQSTADVSSTNAASRLSWHTGTSPGNFSLQNSAVSPTYVYSGWRAGATTTLNSSTEWNRYVLVMSVPEPTALALAALPMLMLTARRRKGVGRAVS